MQPISVVGPSHLPLDLTLRGGRGLDLTLRGGGGLTSPFANDKRNKRLLAFYAPKFAGKKKEKKREIKKKDGKKRKEKNDRIRDYLCSWMSAS